MTRLTLSCADCGANVAIAELRGADDSAPAVGLRVRCPACHTEKTVELHTSGVTVAVEGNVSVRPDATAENDRSLRASEASADETRTSPLGSDDEDSAATRRETNATSGKPTAESSTEYGLASDSVDDTTAERESAPEPTAEPESERDESDGAEGYETVLDELDAVRSAGVKNLRDRSEVEGVARAVGHEALLAFLQDADDAEYRTVVKEATEPRE